MPSSRETRCRPMRRCDGAVATLVAVLAVTLVCAGIIATAHTLAKDAFVQANERLDEARGGAQRALLFPDAHFERVSTPSVEGLNAVYRAQDAGYVFDVSAPGYHGNVQLMIGINTQGELVGIQVVSHTETEGIGTKALSDEYFESLKGMSATGTLNIEEAGAGEQHVDGVSGATFTSKAVVSCLNIAFQVYQQMGGN